MLEPVKAVTAPVADCDNHLGHVNRHLVEIVATVCLRKDHFIVALSKVSCVAGVRSILLVEILADMERLIGVDL